jgi:pimeloyl-ACP methyl ester carboxylesterase
LHGGWGYDIYPFDRQIDAFGDKFRILIPDRSGYGRSPRIDSLPADFHRRAAAEMASFLDALDIDRAVLWGHSDGAVIAAIMGLETPSRFAGLILEAFHYDRAKPRSRDFFTSMASNPEVFGERVCSVLAGEHGEPYWKELLQEAGRAWLKIAEQSDQPEKDFYGGRLADLSVPTMFIHGSDDPRTEPDELDRVQQLLPRAIFRVIQGGGHSPHSERASADASIKAARELIAEFGLRIEILLQ